MRSCLLFLSLLLSSFSLAQSPGLSGSGNSSTSGAELAVTLRTPNGQPVRRGARVQLLSFTGVPVDETTIRGEGVASFLNVSGGMYRVRVSGDGYESTTSDSVEVSRNQRYQSMFMTVTEIIPDNPSAAPGPGTVDSRALRVPAKAKKELDKGMEAFDHGDPKSALEHLNRAIELYPDYVEAYNDLGVIRINQNDITGARSAFETAIRMNDRFAPAYANLARMALERHDLPAASVLVDKAVTSDPTFVDGMALQASVRFFEKRYQEALDLVGRIHGQPHEHFAEVHLIAAEIYGMMSRGQEALAECETYLKEDPQGPAAARVRQTISDSKARKN